MARRPVKNSDIVTALYQRYLNEACVAKVSVRQRRSWQIAAYKCFPDMATAFAFAQTQMKKLQKKHKAVKMIVTNRTERQWRRASFRGGSLQG
jgi:hypothetical protein